MSWSEMKTGTPEELLSYFAVAKPGMPPSVHKYVLESIASAGKACRPQVVVRVETNGHVDEAQKQYDSHVNVFLVSALPPV